MFDTPVAPVYFAVVFLIHPHLGFIVLGSGVALVIVALLNQRVTAVPFNQANNYGARANLTAESMARNAQVINAMGMIPEGVQVWGRETVESLKAQVLGQDLNILMTGLSKFLRLCTQIAILGWGAWLALEAHITSGMVIAASIVASRALAPLEGTIEGWRSFVQARSAYARVRTLLLNSPLNLERLRLPRPAGYLNVERILYVPPPNKKVILNGISFQLKPGESLAIVGDSGTGKTMLARMLVGSIIPTAGSVRLDMMDLRNWDPRQFGESVGYLPQDVQLFPASIKANIGRMRDDARDEDVFDAAETADVHEMISSFAQGYETIVGMDGSPLSGGQRQRIGLARAFYGNPRLIVLDEPNSNLDANGERALAKALLRAKEKQITVVTITQRAALLMSVDKIMILHQGSVQSFGTRDEIIPMIAGRKPNNIPTGPGDPPSLN
jgi:ATP-binding cassette subfamily C protein